MVGYPYTMGQYNSKNEEIFVAQTGANQQIEDLKNKMGAYHIAIVVITVSVVLIILCLCCKRCNSCARKWVQGQLQDVIVVPRAPAAQARTEQHVASTPTKVIFS